MGRLDYVARMLRQSIWYCAGPPPAIGFNGKRSSGGALNAPAEHAGRIISMASGVPAEYRMLRWSTWAA